MTFKHVKFEDSAVMRSLEKLAKEKGLVTSDSLSKKASAAETVDLTPTDNFLENILKLCTGLRQSGFDKQAQEVEQKFFTFKQAQTLYETSSEKGEDLIEAAHPKGSHKLEDVEGDDLAVIETILDQHLKLVDMIEKKPTGKLASSQNILSAVKVVLAQESVEDKKVVQLNTIMDNVRRNLLKVKSIADPELVINLNMDRSLDKTKNPTIDNLEDIKSNVTWYGRKLNPSSFMQYTTTLGIGGLSKDKWSVVEPILGAITTALDSAIALRTEINALSSKRILEDKPQPPAQEAPKPEVNPAIQKIQGARQALNGITVLVNSDTNADAGDVDAVKKWIARVDGALKELESRYASMSPEDVDLALSKITKNFAAVKRQWA